MPGTGTAKGLWDRWRRRDACPGDTAAFVRERWPFLLGGLGLFLVLLILRSWENFLHPSLYVEDASHYFNRYYGGFRDLGFILQTPHGYVNILNNLVAWLVAEVDVRWQPALYQLYAVILAVVTSFVPALSGMFRSRWLLVIAPAVLGLSGMNHVFYYVTLTYQMYVVVVLLLCLMFLPGPRSAAGAVLACAVSGLLIWSGPYSVVAVPVALLSVLLYRGGHRNLVLGWIVVCALVYTQTARGLVRFENLLEPPVVWTMVEILFEDVLFLGLLGDLSVWKAVLVVGGVGALVYRLRNERDYLKMAALFAAVVLCALTPLFLSVKFARYPDPYPCHTLISEFFWLAFLLYSVDRLVRVVDRRRLAGWSTVGAFTLLVTVDQVEHPRKGHFPVNPHIDEFVERIHRAEALDLEERNLYVFLRADGDMQRAFVPRVRVGSRRPDAEPLSGEEIEEHRLAIR